MAIYQIVPYRISVRPLRSDGGETRPLSDVDGKKTTLKQMIGRTLLPPTKGGKSVDYRLPNRDEVTYRLGARAKDSNALFSTIIRGVRGIESTITASGKLEFTRNPNHEEHIEFRTLFVFPKGGKYAIMLTERIGQAGVAGFLQKILMETIRENLPGSKVEIQALTTVADIANSQVLLNSVDFQFPTKKDPDGNYTDMRAADGVLTFNYKFRAAKKLSKYTDSNGEIDSTAVFGVIDPGLSLNGIGITGERIEEMKAEAALHVTLPSGNKRTFTLGLAEGPGLLYAMEAESPASSKTTPVDPQLLRPSDADFERVSKVVLSDLAGKYGVKPTTASACEVPSAAASLKVPKAWKVVWNVPDHVDSTGA